jgi:hypothetical protein
LADGIITAKAIGNVLEVFRSHGQSLRLRILEEAHCRLLASFSGSMLMVSMMLYKVQMVGVYNGEEIQAS